MEKIIDFFNTSTGITVLGFIISFITAFITSKITASNATKNITTQYFKESGVELQKRILTFWTTLFLNDFSIKKAYKNAFPEDKICLTKEDVEMLRSLMQKSYEVCSAKSIKALRFYMDNVYATNTSTEKQNIKKGKKVGFKYLFPTCHQMFLVARIIARLKYDFNGEKAQEIDLIKIKINDFKAKYRFQMLILRIGYFIKEKIKYVILIILAIASILIIA